MEGSTNSAIADFYADRCILITGFTGFVGKVLVEKLLRSLPRLQAVYLLIRPRKGLSAKERLRETLNCDLFDTVRESSGQEAFSKLIPVSGDIMEPGLGISHNDAQEICDKVSIVFHCAATVKFDERMKLALKMNVEGTKMLLELCQRMKRLQAFVHTSTAYCNCDRTYIVEKVYPSPIDWQKLIDCVQWMDESAMDKMTPLIIGPRPNSYTFTKAVAESMLQHYASAPYGLPVIIVRPSIIVATWKEPKPGWIDNYNGANGLIALAAKGLIKTLYGRLHEVRADLVPVDLVVNTLIVSAWRRAGMTCGQVPVIHCTSGRFNPLSWEEVIDHIVHNFTHKMPLANLFQFPGGKTTISRLEYKMRLILLHLVPAYAIDFVSSLIGRRSALGKVYGKIWNLLETLEYFYTNQWDFQSKMIQSMNDHLSQVDREEFYIDLTALDWTEYMDSYHWGVRKYILQEDPSNLALAKRIHSRRRCILFSVNMTLFVFLIVIVLRNRFWMSNVLDVSSWFKWLRGVLTLIRRLQSS